MIHFQHYEHGVCLRASEVKPKLDKFIIERCGGIPSIPTDWWIEYDKTKQMPVHPALNYKLRITANGDPINSSTIRAGLIKMLDEPYTRLTERDKIEIKEMLNDKDLESKIHNSNLSRIESSYFGNQAPGSGINKANAMIENFKETVFFLECLDLIITCFIPKLSGVIADHLRLFFMAHNFGIRQDKGFGSYVLENRALDAGKKDIYKPGENRGVLEAYLLQKFDCFYYFDISIDVKDNTQKNADKILNVIQKFYQHTKNGINRPNISRPNIVSYTPSYLMKQYPRFKGMLNEKKAMKLAMINTGRFILHERNSDNGSAYYDENGGKVDLSAPPIPKALSNPLYMRGLLGFAQEYTFREIRLAPKPDVHADPNLKFNLTFSLEGRTSDGKPIDRFPSPVLFKPLMVGYGEARVYLIFDMDMFRKIDGAYVVFTCKHLTQSDLRGQSAGLAVINRAIDAIPSIKVPLAYSDDFLFDFYNEISRCEKTFGGVKLLKSKYSMNSWAIRQYRS